MIIRFSSIGDIVLTTPVVRVVKSQFKECEVHYLTKRSFHALLESNPYIDKVYSFQKKLQEVLSQLRKEEYDFVIDLHNNLRSKLVKRFLHTKADAFPKLNIQKWLIVNLGINLLPEKHIVDRYLEAASELEVRNDHKGLDFFIPVEDVVSPSDLLGDAETDYVAMVIGGAHETKQMPVELLEKLIAQIDLPIILLGGADVAAMGADLEMKFEGKVFNAAGRYTINQSASLLNQSVKVVSGDTGLMHIAAALKKDVVVLWGNTIPEFGMYPYDPEGEMQIYNAEVKNLRCRPCSKIGYKTCPKKHFKCMKNQDLTTIAAQINLSKPLQKDC